MNSQYKADILNAFANHASVLHTHPPTFGHWANHLRTGSARKHLTVCEPDVSKTPTPRETGWITTNDTYDTGTEHQGLETELTCQCGAMREVPMRWEASFGELLRGVIGD